MRLRYLGSCACCNRPLTSPGLACSIACWLDLAYDLEAA